MLYWCVEKIPFNNDGPNVICSRYRLFSRSPKYINNDDLFADYNGFMHCDMIYWGLHSSESGDLEDMECAVSK